MITADSAKLPNDPKSIIDTVRAQHEKMPYKTFEEAFDATVGNHNDGINAGYDMGFVDALEAVESAFAQATVQGKAATLALVQRFTEALGCPYIIEHPIDIHPIAVSAEAIREALEAALNG